MDVEWPRVEEGVLAFFQRVFKDPWRLDAAYDGDDGCQELLESEFPHMVGEDLRDNVAILMN